ncbi:hypothetical protein GX586_15230 [bacterium]|nr:hypothetical protein [bacterium]
MCFPKTDETARGRVRHAAIAAACLLCATALAGDATNWLARAQAWLAPLPFLYANTDAHRADYGDMDVLIPRLVRAGDAFIFMQPNGDYALYRVGQEGQFIPQYVQRELLARTFESLIAEFPRVWIVIYDPRLRWQTAPPPGYAAALQREYMRLPLPMLTFYGDRALARGSTNYWVTQAHLLETVLDASPANRNPQMFLNLGQVYRRFGRAREAADAYQRGLALFSDDPFLHRELGACYYYDFAPPRYEDSISENRVANDCHMRLFDQPMYDALFNMAMAYAALGKKVEAQLQYGTLLSLLQTHTNDLWQSRTLRYLANLMAERGKVPEAADMLKRDIQLAAQPAAYSYNRLLDLYGANGRANDYAETARQYFYSHGTSDVRAIARYVENLTVARKTNELDRALRVALGWMATHRSLYPSLEASPPEWRTWTNATLSLGLSPKP